MPRKSSRRTNDAGQPPRYTPLPADGEWTSDATWAEVASLLADPTFANRALAALRKVFPPERVLAFEGTLHPLEFDYLQRAARIDLLELGLALANLDPNGVIKRLRNPLEYRTTRAELQTGLMLQRMGAEVEHEPTGGTKGPDWLASWPDPGSPDPNGRRCLGVEVKCLATSHDAEALMRVDMEFIMAFMLGMDGINPSEPAWLTTHLNRDLVDELIFARQPQLARIAALGSEAAEHARRALPTPTKAGTFSMGRAGTFEIALGASGEPRFQYQGVGLPRNDTHEFGRLYQQVQDAAVQLRAVGHPGVVVLDMGRDGHLTNQFEALRDVLATESWASDLAGAIFVDRFAAGGGRSHTLLHIVQGKLFAELDETLRPQVIICDAGHLHPPSLLRLVEPCDCRT